MITTGLTHYFVDTSSARSMYGFVHLAARFGVALYCTQVSRYQNEGDNI
jgi:hypothetical protein